MATEKALTNIEKALALLESVSEYYEPDKNEKISNKLKNMGEIVDFINEDNGDRWKKDEGFVVKIQNENSNEFIYIKATQEVGKTEVQSDGDYSFSVVKPREVIVIEWDEVH